MKWCEERNLDLNGVPPEVAGEFHPALASQLSELLDPRAAAERRTSFGGTAWSEIERQVAIIRHELP